MQWAQSFLIPSAYPEMSLAAKWRCLQRPPPCTFSQVKMACYHVPPHKLPIHDTVPPRIPLPVSLSLFRDPLNSPLQDNPDYSPTPPGGGESANYRWPLEGSEGYYSIMYSGPIPPLECPNRHPEGVTYLGCYEVREEQPKTWPHFHFSGGVGNTDGRSTFGACSGAVRQQNTLQHKGGIRGDLGAYFAPFLLFR